MSHESADVLLRGYHAFVDGDLDAMASMLDPDVEWVPAGESDAVVVSRERVLEVVAERAAEDYHVVVDRAIGLSDRVVVSMRFSRIELDPRMSGRCRAVVRTSSAAGRPSSTCAAGVLRASRSIRISRRLSRRLGSRTRSRDPRARHRLRAVWRCRGQPVAEAGRGSRLRSPPGVELATAVLPVAYARHRRRAARARERAARGRRLLRPGGRARRRLGGALCAQPRRGSRRRRRRSAGRRSTTAGPLLRSSLPVDEIVEALRAHGVPRRPRATRAASFATTSSTSSCAYSRGRRGVRGGFVHVPLFPEQALERPEPRRRSRS